VSLLFRDQVGLPALPAPLVGSADTRRTDELFDIIVDYPDSMAALEDLKVRYLSS
jgi:hypothetical protein